MAPTLKVDAVVTEMPEVRSFLERLTGPAMQQAAARGLTEHAHEQRRQSITASIRFFLILGSGFGQDRVATMSGPMAGR
ncbi:hypothetical protein DEM27_06500 [Metarhizobium album]|uniref:Uncharacterized protein n=1 Tax=Metarhizobium album TaxID=2182425 RepID=A0A2U2DVC9_9HYPH|nr:hypothetical protein DEM27_06500 [Rhizobium album]